VRPRSSESSPPILPLPWCSLQHAPSQQTLRRTPLFHYQALVRVLVRVAAVAVAVAVAGLGRAVDWLQEPLTRDPPPNAGWLRRPQRPLTSCRHGPAWCGHATTFHPLPSCSLWAAVSRPPVRAILSYAALLACPPPLQVAKIGSMRTVEEEGKLMVKVPALSIYVSSVLGNSYATRVS
jgi:hypothetical protein